MDSVEGPLLCPGPKCGTRLGGWNWSGSQCSCGTWVTPSIFLVASRLDRKFDVGPEKSASVLVESQHDEGDAVVTAAPLKIIDRSKAFASKEAPEPDTTGSAESVHEQTEVSDVLEPRGPGRSACSIHWFVTNPPSAVVIFLHPSGKSGQLAKTWVDTQWGGRLLTETSGTAFVFPDSGTSPLSDAREWYNDENAADIDGLCQEMRTLISQIVKKGTPAHRIIIGGLGSGGSAAFQIGIRLALSQEHNQVVDQIHLGGTFCIGGGTADDSTLWNLLENAPAGSVLPPMLLCHAKDDPEVPFALGLATAGRMRSLLEPESEKDDEEGGSFGWFPYKGSRHDGGVRRLANWINSSLQNPIFSRLADHEATTTIDQNSSFANLEINGEYPPSLSEEADAEVFNEIFDSISQEIDASISEAISNSLSDALDEQRDAAMDDFSIELPEQAKDALDSRLFNQADRPEQSEPEKEVNDESEEATSHHIALAIGCLLGISVVAFTMKTFISRKNISSST